MYGSVTVVGETPAHTHALTHNTQIIVMLYNIYI